MVGKTKITYPQFVVNKKNNQFYISTVLKLFYIRREQIKQKINIKYIQYYLRNEKF